MIFVTTIISSNEWIKLHEQASRSWPSEEFSRGEVVRGPSLIGSEVIKQVPSERQKAIGDEL